MHFCDFQNRWPLQRGEPDMSKHLSIIATWKKENHQTYKDPFCRGMMWKNLGPPVSPENPETYKTFFCRGNSCSTFPVFVKSIYIYIYVICKYLYTWMLTYPKTSTEWGTYNFIHTPTTKSGTCPCTPLQALRLSKKTVLTDLYRIRKIPATNLAKAFLYKIRALIFFLGHFYNFQKH